MSSESAPRPMHSIRRTSASALSAIVRGRNTAINTDDESSIYRYEKLQHEDSIRLLVLQPGEGNTPLDCKLEAVRLSDLVSYQAISYVWGKPEKCYTISCGSSSIPITRNLHTALQRVRHPTRRVVLWADAVCIDQDNVNEKGHQVWLMGDIFRNAAKVLIHLSSFENNSEIADQLQALLTVSSGAELVTVLESPKQRLIWTALWADPWFDRAWTVQEVGLARKASLLYKSHESEWEALMKLSSYLTYSDVNRNVSRGGTVRRLWSGYNVSSRHEYSKSNRYLPEHLIFLAILEIASTARVASDPRDLVYAFLAHPKALPLLPDYKKSIDQVNLGLATCWLETYGSADILSFAGRAAKRRGKDSTPSWCPAWDLRWDAPTPIISRPWARNLNATQFLVPATLDMNNRYLHVSANEVDTVKLLIGPFDREDFNLSSNAIGSWSKTKLSALKGCPLTESVPKCLHLAMCRTLTAGDWRADEAESSHWLRKLLHESSSDFVHDGNPWEELSDVPRKTHYTNGSRTSRSRAFDAGSGRCFFTTCRGRFGLGPPLMQQDDLCCLIAGAQFPFVLRHLEANRYQLVGEAYIEGIMEGELIIDPDIRDGFEEFVLV